MSNDPFWTALEAFMFRHGVVAAVETAEVDALLAAAHRQAPEIVAPDLLAAAVSALTVLELQYGKVTQGECLITELRAAIAKATAASSATTPSSPHQGAEQ